jgi:hypothetical protein
MCIPGLDPITLALLAGSTAASVGGGIISRNEANANAQRIADARNAELLAEQQRLDKLRAENAITLKNTMDTFDQPNQEKAAADAEAQRNTEIQANAAPPTSDAGEVSLAGNAPKVIKGAIADRMKEAFDRSTTKAKAMATLGKYGDVWGGNNRSVQSGGRNIDTVNGFARAEAALLPALQDLAGFSASKPSSGIGETLSALGSLGGTYAGAGAPGLAPKATTTLSAKMADPLKIAKQGNYYYGWM